MQTNNHVLWATVESEAMSLQTTAEAREGFCCSKCSREFIPQFGDQEGELFRTVVLKVAYVGSKLAHTSLLLLLTAPSCFPPPPYPSALYVVDLKKFRKIAAGDRLRGQYQALSQDPNSLSNLDQVTYNSSKPDHLSLVFLSLLRFQCERVFVFTQGSSTCPYTDKCVPVLDKTWFCLCLILDFLFFYTPL